MLRESQTWSCTGPYNLPPQLRLPLLDRLLVQTAELRLSAAPEHPRLLALEAGQGKHARGP
eukprot:CAMPEP_0202397672 /NCGR_PEP_ID=MMETSP1128-20130828/727_1 /ASSEMBLY_ACC=CAM_ASM_000463 /TAXON_ID=3047 /ORGANISM="Dunaliella tertiolecta, Strain CCMP1320" /LENGTH=60 /DNA_ID=CAMNT_0049000627 /DNA_START=1274 /DNA_END=1456 /DNA_ORIENTATION=-